MCYTVNNLSSFISFTFLVQCSMQSYMTLQTHICIDNNASKLRHPKIDLLMYICTCAQWLSLHLTLCTVFFKDSACFKWMREPVQITNDFCDAGEFK